MTISIILKLLAICHFRLFHKEMNLKQLFSRQEDFHSFHNLKALSLLSKYQQINIEKLSATASKITL